MTKESFNPEALLALEDSSHILTSQISILADLSNSIGSALADLDKDDANPEVQEKIEEACVAVQSVVDSLKKVSEEINEQNEESE